MLSTLFSRIARSFKSGRPVKVGSEIPEFQIQNEEGEEIDSSDIQDALIYFYPKASTPGCTKQACQLRDEIAHLEDAEITVYGVSVDSVEKQKDFHDSQDLNFDLLADVDGKVAAKFGVLTKGGFAERTSFLIRDRKVEKVFHKVDPQEHIDLVLNYLND